MVDKTALVGPGITVQTDIEHAVDSYPINTGKVFLFDLMALDGTRSMVLGLPITFTFLNEGSTVKVLHVNDVTTNRPVMLHTNQIVSLFPATNDGDYFVQTCRNNFSLPEIGEAFAKYVNSTDDARSLPALQFSRLADLEVALDKVKWVKGDKPANITPEQYAVVAACVDVLFREASRHIGPQDHRLRLMLREAALEVMRLAPTIRQSWLDADTAGAEIKKLRRQLTNATNLLSVNNIPFPPTEEPSAE